MDTFNEVLSVAQKGVIAFGTFWVVWGLVVLGSGLKDIQHLISNKELVKCAVAQ